MIALLRTSATLGLALATLSTGASAQTFSRQVVLRDLAQPTGIAVESRGAVLFSEIPEPGVMGGANRVLRKDAGSTTVTPVSGGEPEPVNIAVAPNGDAYWTCRTAGVVFRRTGGSAAPFLTGLDRPTGIAAPGNGKLYITQIPTPGVPGSMGGRNTVIEVDIATQQSTTISMGEPEPADIVADASGNAYWTCKTAGVLLAFDGATQTRRLLLNDLDAPTGLAMDAAGRLYFTEVPTPGVAMAGNRVWQLEPGTMEFTLISAGEPEPVDVTVTADGRTVYWTCRTAGVIVRADRTGSQPSVTSAGPFGLGDTVSFSLNAPAHPTAMYAAATSGGRGPIDIAGQRWALELDALFTATLANTSSPLAAGYIGLLDANGMGTATLIIPRIRALSGLRLYTGFAVIDTMAGTVDDLSKTFTFAIQ